VLALEFVVLFRRRPDYLRAGAGLALAAAVSVVLIASSFLAVAYGVWDCGAGTGCWG
jgi:hypothetical protein